MTNPNSYEDFRVQAINSKEELDRIANLCPEGTVIYYVLNLGYRSRMENLKIGPDYLTLVEDYISDEIRNKVNEDYDSFDFKVLHLKEDLSDDHFSDGMKYFSNYSSASSGIHGKLCNQHLVFTDKEIAEQYFNWSNNDEESCRRAQQLDDIMDYFDSLVFDDHDHYEEHNEEFI